MGEILLILSLGSNSFLEREKATKMLNNYPLLSSKALTYGTKHPDPEIHRRMEIIQLNQRALAFDILTENYMFPWIDKLPHDYPDRSLMLQKLQPLGDLSPWPKHRESTKMFLRGLHVNGENILPLLEQMMLKEVTGHEYNSLDIRYKLKWPGN